MKILVIGSGGREHALCWRLAQDGHRVVCSPGSAGISQHARCEATDDQAAVISLAKKEEVELVVVGPEAPLVEGLGDSLREAGFAVFGPGAQGARLEGSKAYSKQFFRRHGIPTADFEVCASIEEVEKAIARLGGRVVVKADGLAAGKGVIVCSTKEQARSAAAEMLEGRFGAAGSELVVEERIDGREISIMALCDGKRVEILEQAEDHKAIFDGDEGPNTGGMGTVSPAAWVEPALLERVRVEVFDRTLAGLHADDIDFRGVLYAGLMVGQDGTPFLLEYNVRFGDPETQVVLPRAKGDFGAWLLGAARGALPEGRLEWDDAAAVCVVMASRGYPASSSKGQRITGLDGAERGATVFHAGTRDEDGTGFATAGGRVLGVMARGADVDEARRAAYEAVSCIDFEGKQYRTDIGARRPK